MRSEILKEKQLLLSCLEFYYKISPRNLDKNNERNKSPFSFYKLLFGIFLKVFTRVFTTKTG